jgi:hypothetical protein
MDTFALDSLQILESSTGYRDEKWAVKEEMQV